MLATVEERLRPLLDAALLAADGRGRAERDERRARCAFMEAARSANWNWHRIGEALGMTDVGARRYYERNRMMLYEPRS